jgi:hypothetical protein
MTTRGLESKDFETIAGFIDQGVQIALQVQKASGMLLPPTLSLSVYLSLSLSLSLWA